MKTCVVCNLVADCQAFIIKANGTTWPRCFCWHCFDEAFEATNRLKNGSAWLGMQVVSLQPQSAKDDEQNHMTFP